jgi:hypothetical protein
MAAVALSPAGNSNYYKNIATFDKRHASSLEYVRKSREILISMLGVPESIIDATPRSVQVDSSDDYYMNTIRREDAFLGFVSACL